MRSLVILFFSLSLILASAHDTLKPRLIHSVGFGSMLMGGKHVRDGHYALNLSYDQPGFYAFYKLMLPAEGSFHLAMYLNGCSRSANWNYQDGGLGGGTSVSGNFSLLRAEFGMSGVFVNSWGDSFFDFGLYAGKLLESGGKAVVEEWDRGNRSFSEKSSDSELSSASFGVNVEFSKHFRLVKRNYILAGIRLRFETPDGRNMSAGKMAGIHLGYAFK